MKTKLIN